MPRPSLSVRMKSFSASAGSPKNLAPPWFSSTRSWRWMVPTVALVTLPKTLRGLADRRQRIVVGVAPSCRYPERSHPAAPADPSCRSAQARCSSATRNAMLSTPSCTSFRSSMRDSSSGPISVTVARTGWPCSPNTSQKTVENWSGWKSRPISLARLRMKSLASPTSEMPERSPLMSAANTGTPARANPSAITCSETVFPVPVAPVTRPWRLASASVSQAGCSPLPMKIFSSVSASLVVGGRHCIASSRASGCRSPDAAHHTASCKPIETGQRPEAVSKPIRCKPTIGHRVASRSIA